MQIGKVIKNLNSKYKSHIFSEIKFNSRKCKKTIFLFPFRAIKKMVIYILIKQLKMGQEQLFQI